MTEPVQCKSLATDEETKLPNGKKKETSLTSGNIYPLKTALDGLKAYMEE